MTNEERREKYCQRTRQYIEGDSIGWRGVLRGDLSAKGDDRDSVEDSFNLSKAELFEALGHPTRIRLLEILNTKPTTFSELKRAAELESNGLLGFHLGKLSGLVKLNQEGLYSLTDEGKEALRIVQATAQSRRKSGRDGASPFLSILTAPLARLRYSRTILLAILLIAIIVLGLVVVYQQEQMTRLNNSFNSSTVSIDGQRYWYLEESATSFVDSGSLYFHGVNFTIASLSLSNGTGGGTPVYITGNVTGNLSNNVISHFFAIYIVPNIVANFGKGNVENWNYTPDVLWLSQHNAPRAGISYDENTGLLTFYVSL